MNKTKFFIGTTVVLLIVNLLLVTFIFLRKPPKHHPEGPKYIIIERLGFNENQIKEYESLIDEHRKQIRAADEKISSLKSELYLGLKTQNQSTDSLINEIAVIQKEIENIHLSHFKDIQKLCNEEQQEKFDELLKGLGQLFAPKMPPPRP